MRSAVWLCLVAACSSAGGGYACSPCGPPDPAVILSPENASPPPASIKVCVGDDGCWTVTTKPTGDPGQIACITKPDVPGLPASECFAYATEDQRWSVSVSWPIPGHPLPSPESPNPTAAPSLDLDGQTVEVTSLDADLPFEESAVASTPPEEGGKCSCGKGPLAKITVG